MECRNRSALRVPSPEAMIAQIKILLIIAMLLLLAATAASDEQECSSEELDIYLQIIRAEIYEFWTLPYKNRTVACTVLIKQNFRGEVLYVGIAKCTDDKLIHKSAIDATYEASPVPLPENKACFENDLIVRIERKSLT